MLPNLKELWMSTNTFSGSLPQNIGNASELGESRYTTARFPVWIGTLLTYQHYLFIPQKSSICGSTKMAR